MSSIAIRKGLTSIIARIENLHGRIPPKDEAVKEHMRSAKKEMLRALSKAEMTP